MDDGEAETDVGGVGGCASDGETSPAGDQGAERRQVQEGTCARGRIWRDGGATGRMPCAAAEQSSGSSSRHEANSRRRDPAGHAQRDAGYRSEGVCKGKSSIGAAEERQDVEEEQDDFVNNGPDSGPRR